jgi:hypothetical protein
VVVGGGPVVVVVGGIVEVVVVVGGTVVVVVVGGTVVVVGGSVVVGGIDVVGVGLVVGIGLVGGLGLGMPGMGCGPGPGDGANRSRGNCKKEGKRARLRGPLDGGGKVVVGGAGPAGPAAEELCAGMVSGAGGTVVRVGTRPVVFVAGLSLRMRATVTARARSPTLPAMH